MVDDARRAPPLPPTRKDYTILGRLGRGGMATVHLGRMRSSGGFARLVAIKQLHEHLAADPEIVTLLLEEARISSAVYHPNVASTVDVVVGRGQVSLVQEYVEGVSLSALLRRARTQAAAGDDATPIPVAIPVATAIAIGILRGLGATHDATNARGEPLHVIHRDVSPQNVLVGADGSVRVIDFGIARAMGRAMMTAPNVIAGKLPYMAPEQVLFRPVTKQVDLHAVGVVLWEMLTGERLVKEGADDVMAAAILGGPRPPPSARRTEVPPTLDRIVLRALDPSLAVRYATAEEFERDLAALPAASPREIGELVRELAGDELARRRRLIAESAGGAGPNREEVLATITAGASTTFEPVSLPVEPPGRRPRAERLRRTRTTSTLIAGSVAATAAAIAILIGAPRLLPSPTTSVPAGAPPGEAVPLAPRGAAPGPPSAALSAPPPSAPAPSAPPPGPLPLSGPVPERRAAVLLRVPPPPPPTARRPSARRSMVAPGAASLASPPLTAPSAVDPREYP